MNISRRKIMIADDDFSSRRLLEKIIRDNYTCRIETAEDGSEALQKMVKDTPDLLLLDMLMPVVNGMQVLQTMKRNARMSAIPVIACTAVGDGAVVKEVLKYGVKHYIKKPFNSRSVVEKINAVFMEKKSQEKTSES